MTQQITYLNGQWIPIEEAKISTQDRGFLFGDGVYEVVPVYQKKLFYFQEHLDRLKNSLKATSILNPFSDKEWLDLLNKLTSKHPWQDQYIYLQVTRGIQMQRDHLPAECLTPSIYVYTNPLTPISDSIVKSGIKAITLEDIRWLNCEIKAITLLPNIMMKLAAKQQSADDAILIDRDGWVCEGTASNLFIVKDNILLTPPNSHKILPGVTRLVIEQIARAQKMTLTEKNLKQSDLESADEIWLTSSTKEVLPVTQLNERPVGSGIPGPFWQTIRKHYQEHKLKLICNPKSL